MAITQTGDLDSASTLAYDLFVHDTLRADAVYSSPMIQTVKPAQQTHRGSQVRFWFRSDLAVAKTPLTEATDPPTQSISDSYVDVTINEYGASVGYTRKVKGTDMLPVDANVAKANANQAIDSFDELARDALMGGTNVIYSGQTAQASLTASDTLLATDIREAVAKLRNANVRPLGDGKYLAIVSPYQALDLREETGDAAWITSRNYQDISGINNGFVGTFGGAMFYETSRVPVLADAGAANVDVYQAVVVGPEALACAYAENVSGPTPNAELSPVVDRLNRFAHVGWYWFGGFDSFRQEACWRIETAASLGANT